MGQWIEQKPTMHLRFVIRGGKYILQQQWKVTRGENGRILYTEEWRDIEVMSEEAAK